MLTRYYNGKSPTINPVSDPGEIGFPCETGKSDSSTCSDLMPGSGQPPVPDV
jgi:hypothetical protein